MDLKQFTVKVVKEMLTDRGYEEIKENDMNVYATKSNGDYILVEFVDIEKVSVEFIRQTIQSLTKQNIPKCILVFKNKPSSQVKTFLKDSDTKIDIEIFEQYELGFNVTKHVFVPKHILLDKTERDKVVRKFKAKNIPQISLLDPLSKYYGAKKGDIFHIIRKMGMTYRIVSG
jgi:DNA-directed RNA polymerase I, II, and III subunit RPABC1